MKEIEICLGKYVMRFVNTTLQIPSSQNNIINSSTTSTIRFIGKSSHPTYLKGCDSSADHKELVGIHPPIKAARLRGTFGNHLSSMERSHPGDVIFRPKNIIWDPAARF